MTSSHSEGREALMSAKEKGVVLTYAEQLHMANQVANGMCVIADLGMIHMDLAARNILLGRRSIVKIADFGLTRVVPPGKGYYRLMHTLKLPIKWMALESMVDKIFSTKTDVWGFGITVWECLTYGEIPYGELKNIDVQKFLEDGRRVVQAPHCPLEFHNWLLTCFSKSPRERPSFAEIKMAMADFVAKEKETAKPIRDIGKTINNWNPGEPWAHPLSEAEVAAALTGEFAASAVTGDKKAGSKKKKKKKKKSTKGAAGADPDAPLDPDSMKKFALAKACKKRGIDVTNGDIKMDEESLRAMLKEALAKEAASGGAAPAAAAAAAPTVASLENEIAALQEFARKTRFTPEGKAEHDAKVAALETQLAAAAGADAAPTAAPTAAEVVAAAAVAFETPAATPTPSATATNENADQAAAADDAAEIVAATAATGTPTPPTSETAVATPTPAAADAPNNDSDEESDDSAELSC